MQIVTINDSLFIVTNATVHQGALGSQGVIVTDATVYQGALGSQGALVTPAQSKQAHAGLPLVLLLFFTGLLCWRVVVFGIRCIEQGSCVFGIRNEQASVFVLFGYGRPEIWN